mgnify:CR=1 FL=1
MKGLSITSDAELDIFVEYNKAVWPEISKISDNLYINMGEDLRIIEKLHFDEDKKKMVQPEDCAKTVIFLTQLHPRVCINEITISPTWNRDYVSRLTDQIPS